MTLPEIERLSREIASDREFYRFLIRLLLPKSTITVKEIAQREGCSVAALSPSGKERYLLPRFGESGYPDGPKRWDIMEYYEWQKIPKEERKRMWQEHLRNEKNRRKDSHISRA